MQVSRAGCHLPLAPFATIRINHKIGPSTVSDSSFISEDSKTFTKRQRGCLIYPTLNDASTVGSTKKEMHDDEDGVLDSSLVHPKPISTTLDKQMPVITLHLEALEDDTHFPNPLVGDWSHLALVKLNKAMRFPGARLTMSSCLDARVQP